MIPIRLTLQGIYSYQDSPQTIEFGPLLDAGLFGIFGSVGSGKSSILEAISMALYGEIERMGKRDDRNYNMMNLKSDRLYIDFEFSNYSGQRFRFECDGRRNSRQYDKVNTYSRKASEWKDEEWIPLDHIDGEVVTGLSYHNFKRTVIIPQGRFQEFIGLTPGDRSQMLQDLFSLDRFDLAGATIKLSTRNSEAIHRIEGRLTGYEEVTPEMLKASREQVDQLIDQVKKKTTDCEKLRKEATASTELKKLHDQQKELQVAFQKMKENEPEIRSVEQQLKKYQEARQDFSSRIIQVNEKRGSLSKLENSLDDMTKREEKISDEKSKISQKYESLHKAAADHDRRRREAEEASIAGKLRTANESLQHKEQRIENGMKMVLELRSQIAEKEVEVEKMDTELTENRTNLQNRELLLEIRNAFNRKKELAGQIEKVNERMDMARSSFMEKKVGFLEEYDLTYSDAEKSMVTTILESRLTEHEMTLEDERKKWHQLKVHAEMASYVEQLSPGESCPLCGSTEHPEPAHFEATSQKMEEVKNRITQGETAQKKLEKAKLEWENLVNDQDQVSRTQKQEKKDIEDLQESLRKVNDLLNKQSKEYVDEDNVNHLLDASGQLMETVKLTEQRVKKVRQDIRTESGNLEKYREKIGQFKSARDQLKGEVSSLRANLSEEILSQLDQHTSEEWISLSEQLSQKIHQEKEEYRTISEKRDRIIQEFAELEASIKTTKVYLEKENTELEKTVNQLNDILSDSSFESLKEVRELLKKEIDVEEQEKRIREFEKQIHVMEERLKDLEKQIGDRQFDGEAHESLIRNCEAVEKDLLELREQKNYQAKKLTESQKRWTEKKELAKELSGLGMRAENLKVLEGLFRGKKFVDYVSTVYLREICEIANRRFRKLTNNHFSLVLGEDNQFNVRDYLHDGQIRSVKTLSGGQTFQVSLCLALALAESLQNQNRSRQNFFFLDEGFGTLDGDALRLVMESLKSLRQEGRVVGVISHVESLQDEMDMYLHIRNDAEKGSQIVKSWEV